MAYRKDRLNTDIWVRSAQQQVNPVSEPVRREEWAGQPQTDSIRYTVERTWGHAQGWSAPLRVCPSLTRTCLIEVTLSSQFITSGLLSSCWREEKWTFIPKPLIPPLTSTHVTRPQSLRSPDPSASPSTPGTREHTAPSLHTVSSLSNWAFHPIVLLIGLREEDNWKRNWRGTISVAQKSMQISAGSYLECLYWDNSVLVREMTL